MFQTATYVFANRPHATSNCLSWWWPPVLRAHPELTERWAEVPRPSTRDHKHAQGVVTCRRREMTGAATVGDRRLFLISTRKLSFTKSLPVFFTWMHFKGRFSFLQVSEHVRGKRALRRAATRENRWLAAGHEKLVTGMLRERCFCTNLELFPLSPHWLSARWNLEKIYMKRLHRQAQSLIEKFCTHSRI